MYDELIKRLRELHPEEFGDAWDFAFACQQAMHEAADAIEELQQMAAHYGETAKDYFKDVCYYLERVPKWIPVTERLPDKPGIYAVWTAKGFGNHLSASYFDGDSWSLRITHWMPLPQPPKEE